MPEQVSEEEVVLSEMLTNEKPCRFLIEVLRKNQKFSDEEAYASKISSDIDASYSYLVKVVQKFEKAGLITRKKEGRKEILYLTEHGSRVAKAATEFYEVLEKGENAQ